MIDNSLTHETPEGIVLTLVPVSFTPRVLAWLLDAIVRLVLVIAFTFLAWILGELGFGLLYLGYFLIVWFYPVVCEVFFNGQTLGKKILKIQVCMDNGMPVTWQASMIRNLLLVVDFLPFAFFVGLVSSLCHRQSKRLGDIVANTVVVHCHKPDSLPNIAYCTPIFPPMSLTLGEQQAILMFAERSHQLPKQRCAEIAHLLVPMIKDNAQEPSQVILGYANAIIGTDVVKPQKKAGKP